MAKHPLILKNFNKFPLQIQARSCKIRNPRATKNQPHRRLRSTVMRKKKNSQPFMSPTVSAGRHAAECKICSHENREEIERDFINWRSPATIAKHYKLANRASVYRHAHALDLFPKRQRNVRAALEKIIERAGEVEVSATAIVSAVSAYARINAAGQWVERSERVDLNQLFDRMTATELERYARDGKLPEWFTTVTEGATKSDGQREPENG